MFKRIRPTRAALLAGFLLFSPGGHAGADQGTKAQQEAQRCFGPVEDVRWFEYGDFGPQVLSYELIGFSWWSWDHDGHQFAEDGGTILVGVYTGPAAGLEATRRHLRADPLKHCDPRLITLAQAQAHVSQHLQALDGDPHPTMASLRQTLQQLQTRLTP